MQKIKLQPYFNVGKGGGTPTIVDPELNVDSMNPVSNKAITTKFGEVDQELAKKLTAASLADYATIAGVDAKLVLKADKTQLEGLVTGVEVDEKIAGADFVKPETLNQYETTAALTEKLALKADKTEITNFITAAALEPYAKTEALATKADKSELTPLATKEFVNTGLTKKLDKTAADFVKSVKVAGATMTITKGDGSITTEKLPEAGEPVKVDAYTKLETDNKLALKADKTQLDTLATKSEIADFVTNEDVALKGYITSAALNGYAKTIDIDTKLGKKADKTELSSLATKSEIAGFVNAETVDQKIAAADFVKPATLTSYATKVEIQDFVTDAQVTEKGYITEAALTGYEKTSSLTPKLEAKADKTQLSSLATKSDISDMATKTELSGYAKTSALAGYEKTETLTPKLAAKLDKNSVDFVKGITVSGSTMTITKGDGSTASETLPSGGGEVPADVATKTYVDEKIGAIASQLDAINGEVM